jgi:hypothetical protein
LKDGVAATAVTEEAKELASWLGKTHPGLPKLTPKTIENKIRADHRKAKAPKL